MLDTWQRIDRWFASNGALNELNPPASDDALAQVVRDSGGLPDPLVASLRHHDGGTALFPDGRLLPVADALTVWRWARDREMPFEQDWWPLAADIDHARIVFLDRRTGEVLSQDPAGGLARAAPGFDAWLDGVADLLEAGEHAWHAELGEVRPAAAMPDRDALPNAVGAALSADGVSVLTELGGAIASLLASSGGPIVVPGLGAFSVSVRQAFNRFDLENETESEVPASRTPVLRIAEGLKAAINGDPPPNARKQAAGAAIGAFTAQTAAAVGEVIARQVIAAGDRPLAWPGVGELRLVGRPGFTAVDPRTGGPKPIPGRRLPVLYVWRAFARRVGGR